MANETGFGNDSTQQTAGSINSGQRTGQSFYAHLNRGSELYDQLSYGEDPGFADGTGQYFNDPSTGLAISKGYFIEIYHIISGEQIFFKAFLVDFMDNFVTNYNKEQVFGRPDPIQTYQNTERIINVAFDLVSSNINEAKANLIKSNSLISMMYPSYDQVGRANSIKSGPLFKVKMGNLICKPGLRETEGMAPARQAGLSCTIGGFKYNPSVDDGFFDPEPGIFYPQTINIDLELSIIHETSLGYDSNGTSQTLTTQNSDSGESTTPGFPYGAAPATSLNGGTGDVREDLPSGITQQNSLRNTLTRNPEGELVNYNNNGNVRSNVYVRQEGQLRQPRERSFRTAIDLERRIQNERMRVAANKILSPQDRRRIRSFDRFLFDDASETGWFTE